ncbi:MAG TPA: hypothetical protein VML75_20865 [Kofleriaceae bacterium]|nr:hypothetical protein [Kofleriaceae bacterium]
MEIVLSETSLDAAWELVLEVARARRLPPAQPTAVRTSDLSFAVRVSEVKRWQMFDWSDVRLTSSGHGIVVRYTERSPLAAIGIKHADTIAKINGMDIRSPNDIEDAVFAAIEQNLGAIEVLIRRRLNFVTLRYELVR